MTFFKRIFPVLLLPILLISFLVYPARLLRASTARVVINEIMYNPVGTDTNREWIELYNTSTDSVDLTGWKFLESGVAHGLHAVQGGTLLPAEGYAVVTGSGALFLQEYPTFSGLLFDTSFSLVNTGEPLTIKNDEGGVSDTLSYTNLAADGNGKTWERNLQDALTESIVIGGTPGQRNSIVPVPAGNANQNIDQGNANMSSQNTNTNSPEPNTNENDGQGNHNSNANTPVSEPIFNVNSNDSPLPANQNVNFSLPNANSDGDTNQNSQENANVSFGNDNQNFANSNANISSNQNVSITPVLTRGTLLINEILIQPESGAKEWIELYNTSGEPVDLAQVTLRDKGGTAKVLSGIIEGESYFVLEPAPVSLNNDGDQIFLENKISGTLIDTVAYGSGTSLMPSAIGKSLGRYPDHADSQVSSADFHSFSIPTKGMPNIVNNASPVAVITLQSPFKTSGVAPFSLNATGEESSDPDQDPLSFRWEFGDGTENNEENPAAKRYETPGTYTLRLTVTDTWGESNTAEQVVTVFSKSPSNTGSSTGASSSSSSPVATACTPRDTSGKIRITEVLPNPVGIDTNNEFIEIANLDTRSINLCGWQVDDAEGGSAPYSISYDLELEPGEYLALYAQQTKLSLGNTSDAVRLFTPQKIVIDSVTYTNPPEGKSWSLKRVLARHSSRLVASTNLLIGMETNDNGNSDWEWVTPSPGQPTPVSVQMSVSDGVIISELFTDPDGADEEAEFIELQNISEHEIDLTGWQLSDGSSSYTFPEETILEAQALRAFYRPVTHISLNNTTDAIELFNPNHEVIDKIMYEKSEPAKSFSRFVNDLSYVQDSVWEWSLPTPDLPNVRIPLSVTPDPPAGTYREPVRVSFSSNKTGTKIFYAFSGDTTPDDYFEYTTPFLLEASTELWFFGLTSENDRTGLVMAEYRIDPSLSAGTGSLITTLGDLAVSEIFPDPGGKDAGREWIEVYNRSDTAVDLNNFTFTNKKKQRYTVDDSLTIEPGRYAAVFIDSESFSLTNTEDTITLLDAAGDELDRVHYRDVRTDRSFVRGEDFSPELFPSDFPTPGESNIRFVLIPLEQDRDRDLIKDDLERELRTDTARFDTDGDHIADFFEFLIGSDPLVSDADDAKTDRYEEYLKNFVTLTSSTTKSGLFLQGKSLPNSSLLLKIFSALEPQETFTIKTSVKSDGTYSAKLTRALPSGLFDVQAIITDPEGVKSHQSRAVSFVLEDDYVPPVAATKTKAASSKTKPSTGNQNTNVNGLALGNENQNSPLNGNENLNTNASLNFLEETMLMGTDQENDNTNASVQTALAADLKTDLPDSSGIPLWYWILGGVLLAGGVGAVFFWWKPGKES